MKVGEAMGLERVSWAAFIPNEGRRAHESKYTNSCRKYGGYSMTLTDQVLLRSVLP